MDKLTIIPTTRVARGVPIKRKYVGSFWVTEHVGRAAHRTSRCPGFRTTQEYQRVPVYEEEGELFWVNARDITRTTELCKVCPDLEGITRDWMEQGACYGSMDLGFANGDKRVIKQYCERCPVTRECFEYGAAAPNDNLCAIFGGLKFPNSNKTTKKWIVAQRKRMDDESRSRSEEQ